MALSRALVSGVVLAGTSCVRPTPQHPWIPERLPRHGFFVGTWGLGGIDKIVIDYDRHTLRYIAEPFMFREERRNDDRTFPIAPAVVEKLRGLAVAAQREVPHGEEPRVTDVGEELYAIDGDQHFEAAGTLFDASDVGEPAAWRPNAARLLEATFELAKTLGAVPGP